MARKSVTVPQLVLIGATRAMAGAGIGLLIADRLDPPQRRAIGWTLLAIGALSTIPLAAEVLTSNERALPLERMSGTRSGRNAETIASPT